MGQSAIDAGGPLRHFFTLVSQKVAVKFFEGSSKQLLPKVDANTMLSEVFVVVGKIIAHSIVYGCNGFPFLSQSALKYIATGSIMEAATSVSPLQVSNNAYKHFIKEVFMLKAFVHFY